MSILKSSIILFITASVGSAIASDFTADAPPPNDFWVMPKQDVTPNTAQGEKPRTAQSSIKNTQDNISYTYTQSFTRDLPTIQSKGLNNPLILRGPSFPSSKTPPLPVYGDPRSYEISPLTNPYAMPNNPLYPEQINYKSR